MQGEATPQFPAIGEFRLRRGELGAQAVEGHPELESAQPVLAVSTRDGMYYFSVNDPVAWELRLL